MTRFDLVMRRALALAALVALVALVACARRHPLTGVRCEGGVRNGREGMGGECMEITGDKPDSHPDTIGSLRWWAMASPTYAVRKTAAKGRYELVLDGKVVGTALHEEDDRWVTVLFDTAGPSPKTLGRRLSLRDDAPGPFI